MAYDLTAIKMNVDLGDTKKIIGQYNDLVKTLETKHVTLNIDVSKLQASVALANKEIEKAYSKASEEAKKAEKANKDFYNSFTTKKSLVSGFDMKEFTGAFKEARKEALEIQNITANYGKNSKGEKTGQLDSVMVQYTNNLGKVITETLAWAEKTDKAGNIVGRQWQNISTKITDNKQALEKLAFTTQKVKDTMGDKMTKVTIGNDWVKSLDSYKQLQNMVNSFDPSNLKQARVEAYDITQVFKQMQQEISKVKLGDKMAGDIDKAQKQLDNFVSSMNQKMTNLTIGKDGDWATKLSQFQQLQSEMSKLSSMQANGSNLESVAEQIEKVNGLYAQTTTEITRVNQLSADMSNKNAFSQDVTNKIGDYNRKLDEMIAKNQQLASNPVIQKIRQDVERLNQVPPTEFTNTCKQIDSELKKVQSTMASTATKGAGLFASLGNTIKSAFSFMTGSMVIYQLANEIRNIPTDIKNLDTALVDLRKTTSMNSEELDRFYTSSNAIAKQLGVTTKDIIEQASSWSRLGYATKEQAETMSQVSAIFKSISTSMSMDEATDGLVSTMKAFDIEANEALDGIVSKINIIGNTQAVSNEDIVEFLTRSSSAMAEANNTLEETISLGVAATEITRDAASTGQILKTTSMRIRGYSEETQAYTEDVEVLSGKIADLTKTASNMGGISLFTDETKTEYKSTYKLLEEISGIYDELTDKNQAQLLEALAGKRNGQAIAAIINNFSAAQKSMESMANSQGNAMKEMEIIYDSIDYKLNRLKETWIGLSQEFLERDTFKSFIDGTTSILDLIDACGGLQTILVGVVASFISLKAASFFLAGGDIAVSIKTVAKSLFTLKTVTDANTISTLALSAAQKTLIGVGIVAGLMGVVGVYKLMTEATERAEKKVAELGEELNTLSGNTKSIESLAKQFDELSKLKDVQGLNNEEQQKFYDVQQQLKEVMPDVNGYYDEQGRFIISNSENMDTLIARQKEYVDLKRLEYAEASKDTFKAHSKDYDGEYKTLQKVLRLRELYYKAGDLGLTNEETSEFMGLRGYVEDMNTIDDEIKRLSDASSENLKKAQQDILNIVYATDDWGKASEEQKDSIISLVASIRDVDSLNDIFSDVSTSSKVLIDNFDSLYNSSQEVKSGTMTTAEYMNKLGLVSQKTGVPIQVLKKYFDELDIVTAETNNTISDSCDSFKQQEEEAIASAEAIKKLKEEMYEAQQSAYEQSSSYDLLLQSINDLNEGKELTGETIMRLTSAYKNLTPKIDETTGSMYLEVDALKVLATKEGDEAQQAITYSINKTKQVAFDSAKRIGVILDEVLAVNSAAEAYSLLATAATTANGGYRPTGLDDSTWGKSANNISVGINGIILDLAHLYEEAEKTAGNINTATQWDENNDKSSKSSISDKFKKELEDIQLIREKIQREIDLLQESINLDSLLGKSDPNKANKMTDLLDQLRGISEIQIGKFNGLAQIYKEQEQLGELESLIADARKQGYIDEQSYIQYTIDLLNQKYDVEKRAYDDKLRLLNYEQEYTHEDSQEYADIEQQKLDMVVAMQKSCMDKVRELKEKGLSDESEDVRKYIDLYKDMLEEQLNLEKSMAEKRKQLELDRLNDLQKDLGDKQSAMKSYIDMVMQMLRDQYNEEKKMIEDNYKLKQDKLKQELDSYKKIIDAKKKSLEDEANTEDYNDEVSKRQKELADMKANAALLGKDETAKAQYEKLLEEIAQKEKDLAKYQRDHNIKLQQESLDKEYDLYEENINKELDALEKQKENELEHVQKMLDSEVELRRKAIQLIEKDNDKLYKQLQKWAEETGKKTQDEVSDAWNGCTDAINTYNDGQMNVLDTLDKISQKLKDVKFDLESVGSSHWTDWDNSSSTGNGNSYNKPSGGSNTSSRDKKIEEMIKLGDQMKGKKKEEVDKLLAQQQKIASEIGAFFENDTWYLMFNGKKVPIRQAIGVRHNGLFGGRVGDGMKANEKLMKLTTDEWVINDSQYKMLNKNIDNLIGSKPNGDITITFDTLMKVDKIDKNVDIDALTTKATDMVFKKIKSNFNIRGIK